VAALVVVAMAVLPAGAGAVPPTGRISGTVTAEGGGVLEEVWVCAENVEEEEGYGCDKTRADGTYEITGLPAGEYIVEFWTEGTYVTQYWEEANSRVKATPVVVTAGDVTPGIDAELERSASIGGTVTAAATGAPVQYVEACASLGEFERCGWTNSLGEYTIFGLYEGSWNVYFYTYEAEADVVSAPYAGGPVPLAAKEAKTNIDAALVAGGQILGTVRSATTNAGLSGVEVCLTEADYLESLGCLTTGSSGAYRFYGIWSGRFKVVFSPEEKDLPWSEGKADPYPTQWWNQQTTFATATPISITPPAVVTGVDASLAPIVQQVQPITSSPTPRASTKPLKCARGFVKRQVKGKLRCVKRKKPKKHHKRSHHKSHHGKRVA